jgi:hypothetical protein
MLQLITVAVIILIFISGAFLYKEAFGAETNFRFTREVKGRSFSSWCKKEFTNTETENLFRQAGLKIPAFLYQLIRYSLLAVWLAHISYLRLHDGKKVTVLLALWLVLLVVSKPARKLLKYKSPFLLVCEQINRRNKAKINTEIDRCLSQLKNIAKTMSGNALSSDYIIKELSKYTKVTKPYFLRLLGFWYEGRYKEGQEYFSNAIGTEEARELAGIFTKLDYLAHDEFISQLEMYQNQIRSKRKTSAQKANERQGNIIFLIALLSGIIILINFLVVVIGIDAISMLQKVSY